MSLFHDVNSPRSRLSCQRMPLACKRLSTHERVKKSLYSIQMQDDPERHAQQDGYTLHLSPEEVQRMKGPTDCSGFYRNGEVGVEERELALAGTVGQHRREGRASPIQIVGAFLQRASKWSQYTDSSGTRA